MADVRGLPGHYIAVLAAEDWTRCLIGLAVAVHAGLGALWLCWWGAWWWALPAGAVALWCGAWAVLCGRRAAMVTSAWEKGEGHE